MMKKAIFLLFVLLFCSSCATETVLPCPPLDDDEENVEDENDSEEPQPVIHQFYPNAQGRLDVSKEKTKEILPGDTIYLRGPFHNVKFTGLQGSADRPIYITNYPGEVLVVGEPNWPGGAYCNAVQLQECHHVVLGGQENSSFFKITGSVNPNVKGGYIGISLQPFTDNVEVKNISILGGAIGIMSKTDPKQDDPLTWHPITMLHNLSIHDVEILNVTGESMYIGHTSINWGWDENGKGYSAGVVPKNPSHQTVMPVRWNGVKVFNNRISGAGWDGIQVSSAHNVEIYNNEVSDFGLLKVFGQSIGIIVGGNSTNTNVHNNYIRDGFGEGFQIHGSGRSGSNHRVYNNLFSNIEATGIGIYGLTEDVEVDVINNTVVNCFSTAVTVNGRGINTLARLRNNLFIACHLRNPVFDRYVATMNQGGVEQEGNLMFYSALDAGVDSTNYYVPLPGSPVQDEGSRLLD